jgi:hypothetical protein
VSIEDVVRELEARVSRLEAEAHRRAGQRKRHAARVIEAGPTEPATHDGTGLDGRCIRRARIAAGWTQGDLGVAVVGADAADHDLCVGAGHPPRSGPACAVHRRLVRHRWRRAAGIRFLFT